MDLSSGAMGRLVFAAGRRAGHERPGIRSAEVREYGEGEVKKM